ncbi:MAG: LAGLIDADG family homing endonuclease, partial [Planctomycetaceae bacterium]
LRVRLRVLKVLLRKHIPEKYLRAAPWQRLALLQGLMDTDGSIGRNGHCEITLKDDQLAHDLGELLSSLGFKWRRQQRYVHRDGRRYGPYLRYHFTACSDFPVFRLSRKRARLQPRPAKGGTALNRYIVAITPVASVPVRCIQVDSPSSLYLAGKKMVPT